MFPDVTSHCYIYLKVAEFKFKALKWRVLSDQILLCSTLLYSSYYQPNLILFFFKFLWLPTEDPWKQHGFKQLTFIQ